MLLESDLFLWLLLRFSCWFSAVCVLVLILLNLSCLRFIRLESIMSSSTLENSQTLSFNISSLRHSLSSGTLVEQMLDFFTSLFSLFFFFIIYILFISVMHLDCFLWPIFQRYVTFVCWVIMDDFFVNIWLPWLNNDLFL